MSDEAMAVMVLLGGLMGWVGFIIALICVALVAGFTRSTHTVQYIPHETPTDLKTDDEVLEDNEKILLDKVGKIKRPQALQDLDSPLEDISKSDIHF